MPIRMRVLVFDHMNECTEASVQQMLPLVSEQRREQALRYKHTFGRFCCLKSWLMLKELMGHVGTFDYNEHGKPYLPDGPYFSISHCKNGIAVAVDDQPIGIDIEAIRHANEELIANVMSEKEKSQISHPSPVESARAFTRLWTQKEAIVKAEGTGITSFEQLQTIMENGKWKMDIFENKEYIYSIAHKSEIINLQS